MGVQTGTFDGRGSDSREQMAREAYPMNWKNNLGAGPKAAAKVGASALG